MICNKQFTLFCEINNKVSANVDYLERNLWWQRKQTLEYNEPEKWLLKLFKLVETKGYEAVTIQDIADEAMINRATFMLILKTNSIYMMQSSPLRLVLLPLFLIRNNWLMATVSAWSTLKNFWRNSILIFKRTNLSS